ncbi:MAG: 2-amino-4-hydroxy-6-hydroxymethyldihydropteridine diphosphokinase [Deltaproteobacteria bacterium]|nr:2-amino-4-hydroxy-6-hydroxymethyldihydropteridine diphosphokinase [Deltaproteobacteria bacterium]
MNVTAYIGFGSNLGDLVDNFNQASLLLKSNPQIEVLRVSGLYHTEPLTPHNEAQPWYLNSVFEIQTSLTLHSLLGAVKAIEQAMGRATHKRWASRKIDLDILFYGNVIYGDDKLHVPHKEMIHRKFVLKPLCDLIPDFIHPDLEIPLKDILKHSTDHLQVSPYNVK